MESFFQKVYYYIILNIIFLGQKMSLPTGQVADKIYLPRATGKPLMSHPAGRLWVKLPHSAAKT